MVFNTNYCSVKVKSIAECSKGPLEHSAILSTFIKLPFAIKIFVLSIYEKPVKTGLTVHSFKILYYISSRTRVKMGYLIESLSLALPTLI